MTDLYFDRLPEAQRLFWSALRAVDLTDFTLYGGTAIALRLGHRTSIDFDFFSAKSFRPAALRHALGRVAKNTTQILQEEPNTYSFLAREAVTGETVKFSFFGDLAFGRIASPDIDANGVAIASLKDLFATKLAATFNRVESKDYLDLAALIMSGIRLEEGISCLKAIHPVANPSIVAKTLCWFEGGDLHRLDEDTKNTLRSAATGLGEIPPSPATVPISG